MELNVKRFPAVNGKSCSIRSRNKQFFSWRGAIGGGEEGRLSGAQNIKNAGSRLVCGRNQSQGAVAGATF